MRLHIPKVRAFKCDAAPITRDPTGTLKIRTRYNAAAVTRWNKVKRIVAEAIVKQDMLGLSKQDPSAMALAITLASRTTGQSKGLLSALPDDGKVHAFQAWFDDILLNNVTERDAVWLEEAIVVPFQKGLADGKKLTRSTATPANIVDAAKGLHALLKIELQGICEAVSQQCVREVALALMHSDTPAKLGARMMERIEKVGITRTRAAINLMVVMSYNEALLDQFAAAGVQRVGLIPESRPPKKFKDAIGGPGSKIGREEAPSASTIYRIRKAQERVEKLGEVEVLTAGDDDVCPICEDIADEGPYSIDTARSLIPAHPECRCTFVPVDDERFSEVEHERDDPEG